MPHTKVTMMKSRKMTKTWDETDPHNDVIFGRRRSDSVVDDLTNKELFGLNKTFSSEASNEWQETQKVRMEVGRLMKIFVGGKSGSVHAQTLMIVSKIYI